MKTRRSISKEETITKPNSGDTPGKRKSPSKVCRTPNNSKKDFVVESINESKLGSSVKSDGSGVHESRLLPNVCSSPVVRVLRSRVITSDNEDEVKNSRTPRKRYSKGSLKEDKPLPIENEETPSNSEEKKTRKSTGSGKKMFSVQNLFNIAELEENEDSVKSLESCVSVKDDPDEPATSLPVTEESETADSRTVLQIKIEDRDISQTKKEKTPRDKLKEDKSIENEGTPKSEQKKTRKSLGSGKKRSSFQNSFVVVELKESEDTVKSTKSTASPKDDPEETATTLPETEKSETADSRTVLQVKIEDSELDRYISPAKKEKTPRDKLKKEKSIENEGTPKSEQKKTRKSLGSGKKRSSFQNSFDVVELKENEDAVKSTRSTASPKDIRDEPATSVTVKEESETTDSHKCLQEPNVAVEDETSSDLSSIKNEGNIQDAAVKKEDSGSESDDEMSATVSQDSSDCLVKRAMVKTSRAIREEKKRRSLDISEKKSMDAVPEENSEDGEAHQSEAQITQHMEAEGNEQDEDSDDERDSDEDMPEAISFSSGREQMNKAVMMAAEAIRKEKERRKEQQRKRMKMIRTQKEEKEKKRMEKLKSLEMNLPQRLSEDVVNRLPDKPEIPTIKPSNPKKKKKMEGAMKEEEKTESKKKKISKFDDYIPLDNVKGATKFGVVPLEVMQKIPKSASDKAAQFKRQALFGSRIKREPSKNLLAYKQKIGASSNSREMNQHQRFKPYW